MGPQVDKSELPHDEWFWCDSVPYSFDYSKDVDGERLRGKRHHHSEDICADPCALSMGRQLFPVRPHRTKLSPLHEIETKL